MRPVSRSSSASADETSSGHGLRSDIAIASACANRLGRGVEVSRGCRRPLPSFDEAADLSQESASGSEAPEPAGSSSTTNGLDARFRPTASALMDGVAHHLQACAARPGRRFEAFREHEGCRLRSRSRRTHSEQTKRFSTKRPRFCHENLVRHYMQVALSTAPAFGSGRLVEVENAFIRIVRLAVLRGGGRRPTSTGWLRRRSR